MKDGRGGRRPGAGRKRKSEFLRSIDGGAGKRGDRVVVNRATLDDLNALHELEVPENLTTEEAQVWVDLAPFALSNRTLMLATALSFAMLCRNIVLERRMARNMGMAGGADHRGMIQRVDAELLRFNLSPCGKSMYEPVQEKPANPLERFLKRG